MSSGSQSLAAPSASAMASTMAPISSSFRSFHTWGLVRCPAPAPSPGFDCAARVPIPVGTARRAWTRIPVASTATTARCQDTGNATAVAAMPAEPPTTVPRLKQPCRVGSTAVPVMRSTSAPSTLTATSPAAHARRRTGTAPRRPGARTVRRCPADDDRARDGQASAERDDRPGAEPGHEAAGTQDADHGTDGQPEEDQSHLPGGQPQLIADIRGARDPGRQGDARQKEQEEQSPTAAVHGAVYQGELRWVRETGSDGAANLATRAPPRRASPRRAGLRQCRLSIGHQAWRRCPSRCGVAISCRGRR